MRLEAKRLFVGNLPSDVTEIDINKRFSKFGNVLSLEIKQRADSTVFAFLDLETDAERLNSCLTTLTRKKWNGNIIKLEFAKESFLSRLEKERQENSKPKCHNIANDLNMNEKREKSKKRAIECEVSPMKGKNVVEKREKSKKRVIEHPASPKKGKKMKEKVPEVEGDSDGSDSEMLYCGKLKMFGGTSKLTYDDSNVSSSKNHKNELLHTPTTQTDLLQRLEEFSDVWKDSPFDCDSAIQNTSKTKNIKAEKKLIDETKRLAAEDKRKKSVDEKRKSLQRQKYVIKEALMSLDSNQKKKKIIFDSDDEEHYTEGRNPQNTFDKPTTSGVEVAEKSKKKSVLFEESSDIEETYTEDFKIKSQFEGPKGQKLLKLQSRFSNDRRFTLDERFYDSDEDVPVEKSNGVETGEVEDERQRQFKILQDVLGYQIPLTKEKKDKPIMTSMLRFDPTKPDHAKYEKCIEPKLKKKRIRDISMEEEPKVIHKKKGQKAESVVVSKEKFYSVSEKLKSSLKKTEVQEEFSLRKMFGAGSDDKEQKELYNTKTLEKSRLKEWTRNPFKHDSSDSEEETEDPVEQTNCKPQQNVNGSWSSAAESFFFKPNDSRLQEGLDFFSTKINYEAGSFSKHRRELNRLFRAKVKNNLRNHRPFKKKLGGQKAKNFRKKN